MRSRAGRQAKLLAIPLLVTAAAVGSTAGAHGAEVRTTNACYSSFETRNRDLDMTLTGSAAAGADGRVTLSALSVSSALPDFMPVFGYNLGILQVGRNDIAASVHVAIAATHSTDAIQVLDADLTATTTVTDPDGTPGSGDETATPLAVTVALPDSVWTPDGSGPVEFSQAAPGTLPEVAGAGPGGAAAKPKGSIFVRAEIGPAKLSFDCQPGTTNLADLAQITPAAATSFSSAAVESAATPSSPAGEDGDGSSGGGLPIVGGAVAIAVLACAGVVLSRRRRATG